MKKKAGAILLTLVLRDAGNPPGARGPAVLTSFDARQPPLSQPQDLVKPAPARGLGRLARQCVPPPALDSQGRRFEAPLDDGAVAQRADPPVAILRPLLPDQHHRPPAEGDAE